MLFSKNIPETKVCAPCVTATPVLFKDFNKTTKDLLTKNFCAPGSWKVESKYKGPKDSLFVNPQAGSDGSMSVDVEYAFSQQPVSVKLNVTPSLHENAKLTLSCNKKGHKLETVLHKKERNLVDYELIHEACNVVKRVSMHEKLTKQVLEVGLGVEVVPNCHIGCGTVYRLKECMCDWNVGCRWADKGYEVSLFSNRQKAHTANIVLPLSLTLGERKLRALVAGETMFRTPAKTFDYAVGVSATCPMFPLNTIKAKIDHNLKWAVSYVLKTEDNWAVTVSLDKNMRCGVLLSHS
ncbi:unnamed protein product [Phytomonas sp. EM1]|nr:unnamed protein product [Phytomonas sp. EM1]|eukprot:CCW62878.1 unnamed protein product [Phytomonas sp. isolate EM1]